MADIPNSNRYRTTGRNAHGRTAAGRGHSHKLKHSAQEGAFRQAHQAATGEDSPAPNSDVWPGIIAIATLTMVVMFPAYTLAVIGLLTLAFWVTKK